MMVSEQAKSAVVEMPRSSLFYGWIIVGAGFVLLMISSGITYSTPVLFHLFEADFGIGRGQAAFIFSFSQVMAFVIGPIAGSLAERRGPRLVVGGGIILMAAGLLGAKKPSRRRRHTRKLSSEIPPCTSAVRVGTLLARAVVAEERLDGAHAADKEGLAALIELIEANTRSH